MLKLASQAGISISEFWDMSWAEYDAYVEGYVESHKHDWRLVRTNAYLNSVYSGLSGKARKSLKPERMLPMQDDHSESLTDEDKKAWIRHFNRKVIKREVVNGNGRQS